MTVTEPQGEKEWSVEELLSKAEDLIDAFQFEAAEKFVTRVLDTTPESCLALQFHASILIETGRHQLAVEALEKAIGVEPDAGYEKYFALAQLSEGAKAFGCYERGVSILRLGDEEDKSLKVSSALCAAAELYMTDLCDQADAEDRCTKLLQEALATDPTNPEVYRVMADLLLVQQNTELARESMTKCYSLWRMAASPDPSECDPDSMDSEPTERGLPNYDFRLACAKIMLELSMFEEAEEIIDQLLADDDEACTPWYLLGVLNVMCDSGSAEIAREAFTAAEALVLREDEEEQDEELLASIRSFLADLPTTDE